MSELARGQGRAMGGPVGLVLVFLLLAGAVSLINPLFEPTDELRHYRYVRHLVVRHALPVQGQEAVRSQSHHPPLYYALSALLSGWVASPHTPEYQHPINPFWGYRNWEVGVDNKLQYLHSPAERRSEYLAALIPRWVNVLLGAVTVWLTWRLAERVLPDRPALAWGAAALVALNPQFIYLSAAINNDIIAAATGAAVLWVCLELVQEGLRTGRLLRLGLLFGLALLSKFHLIAFGGIIAVAVWIATRRATTDRRSAVALALRGLLLVLAIAALLSGWWFARNAWLYGDLTGLNKVNELWHGRPAGGNWWALKQGLPYLWSSLWARFGYGQIPLPQPIYTAILALCALALAGYLLPRRAKLPAVSLALLALTVLGFTGVVGYYILIQPAGPMGRFLFPALPALAVLLVTGWERWLGRPAWTAAGVTLGMGVLALVALGGYLLPAVRYPPPAAAPDPAQALQVGDVARAQLAELRPQSVRPGEPVFVTVVWEPLRPTDVPYAVYVHLIDESGALVAQRDTWPGLSRAPTTAWRPGQPFADTYRLDIPPATYAPTAATVRVGLYEPTRGRLPVTDARGSALGDGFVAGELAVEPRPGPYPNAQEANFAGQITLVGYTLSSRVLRAGETFTLTLYWQPGTPQQNYSVFAQVLGDDWQVWGSQDGPSPDWSAGGVVTDVRRITLRPDTPPGSYPVQVGLYHSDTGRLPVVAPDGHYLDERVVLGPIRVTGDE